MNTILVLAPKCKYIPALSTECPPNPDGLPDCSSILNDGDMCKTNGPLPDESQNYDVNNCQKSGLQLDVSSRFLGDIIGFLNVDVFKCVKRKCLFYILLNIP